MSGTYMSGTLAWVVLNYDTESRFAYRHHGQWWQPTGEHWSDAQVATVSCLPPHPPPPAAVEVEPDDPNQPEESAT